MGRPPLKNIRTHVKLAPEDLARIDAIVGQKGRSKFVRDAISQLLDQVAPDDASQRPPYLKYDGSHEPRLTKSGTAMLFDLVRRDGFDYLMMRLEYADPIAFVHALLGYRSVSNEAVRVLIGELLPKV